MFVLEHPSDCVLNQLLDNHKEWYGFDYLAASS